MALEEFARDELKRAGLFDKDSDYDGGLGQDVMTLIELFAAQGHSGGSAARVISLFSRLAKFDPLTPLTGADDEWWEPVKGGDALQNRRCYRVFKDRSGNAYFTEGKVFRDQNGHCFTNRSSHVPVTFPYLPKTEYVDVRTDE